MKNQKNRVRGAFDTRLRFLIVFGKVWGGFWEGFGWIFGGFPKDFGVLFGRHLGEAFQVAGFTLRIRATRGRSTERQRDRETERADLIL